MSSWNWLTILPNSAEMGRMTRREFLAVTLAAGELFFGGCGQRSDKRSSLSRAKVVVAGGGFGGLNVARTLRRLAPELAVILIERNSLYISCPGSNQVLAGIRPAENLTHDFAARTREQGINVLIGEITGVDARLRQVKFGDGALIPYDRLVMAPGIEFRWDSIEGYDEPASQTIPHAWKAGAQTALLSRQLRAMPDGGRVVITVPDNPYRCPPGPYERASLIAHFLKRHNPRAKLLILDAKTRFSKQPAFMQAWRALYPGMIEWVSSEHEGKIDHIDSNSRVVHTEFNAYQADVLNVIPPQQAGKLAQLAGLTDATGWCPVDPLSFESTLLPGIHVIGDACTASPMPKSAFSAQSQAKICAAAIVALLENDEPAPPRLINHCYSFLDPDHAISVTGVYGYQDSSRSLEVLSSGETPPDGDWLKEAGYARDWYRLLMEQTFG